ncbi:Hypothetical protein I595_3617 [Croceitalea dokdonensis DOKDO 023]|uniref:Lipoprotein n=1 Tax=Croceitalea dokdonensis DOKDO 023 TaxID=1300341 RepID=A0A0P7AY30_9FLAO|nr:Hypothetical protein I595_3617 [Croceitalea dokdonensis DOKDO 023]
MGIGCKILCNFVLSFSCFLRLDNTNPTEIFQRKTARSDCFFG